ncbi:MAG: HD domain-containing phosphohydrolase [Thermotogota bacterium]
MKLKEFIRSKIIKICTIVIISFLILITLVLSFFIIRNDILERSNVKTLTNYLTQQTKYFFLESEEHYNELLSDLLSTFYNDWEGNIKEFMLYADDYLSSSNKEELIVEDVNYYYINKNGIIYESDFEKDIGVDIKNAADLWDKLINLNPGEVYLDTIAEEIRTGRNRLYSYLKLNNGDIFELGLSFENIHLFYEDLKENLNNRIVDINIFSSYFISILNTERDVTDKQKEFFKESLISQELVLNKGLFEDEYYYTIKSEYGNKYILFNITNNYILGVLSVVIISIVFLIFYLKYLRNQILKEINKSSSVVSDIAKDMTFFKKESDSQLDYTYTGINEIDIISKRYMALSKEINASFEVLKAMNEQLEEYYKNNEHLIEKMNKLTKLVVEIKNYKKDDEIFSEIFNMMFDFIPVSDTGLLIRLDYDFLRVVDAKGYEIEKINNLEISTDNYVGLDGITIIKGNNPEIRTIKYTNIPEEKYEKLKELIYPVAYSLYIPIKSNHKRYGAITLNILEPNKEFSEETIKFANFFSEIIELYLSTKNYGEDIRNSYKNFANKLATIAEAHDHETGNHIIRVGKMSAFIAEKLGLKEEKIREIEDFAPLHDIGKIFIPNSILKKNGKLTEEEWEIMKKHTILAKRLLEGDKKFEVALNIALFHHEKYDGTGYPNGMKENEIPIEAQIVAIVDVYDALRSKRPYKNAYSHEKSLEIIFSDGERTNRKHFNPEILEIINNHENEIDDLWNNF